MKQDESIFRTQNKQALIEPARVEELPSFMLAGISTITTNAAELCGSGKISGLFEQFHSHNVGGQLGAYLQQPGLYNCYFNYEQGVDGQYEVMVGVHIKEELKEQNPESVSMFTVPAAKYAVFVTERGPIIEMVQQAWAGIWQWAQQPGNERTFSGDFEFYDENVDPNDGQAKIYIAIP